jgi:ribosomal protein S18 acetylase RimI-like enzyme
MSKEMRKHIDKVKKWEQFNESIERIDIKYNKYGGEVFLLDKKIGHFLILDMDKYLVIDSIKIDEDFRGRGIGENVIRYIINHYPHNIISITPSPFEPNFNNLIKFYKRIGFVENIGENKIEYINQPFYLKKT